MLIAVDALIASLHAEAAEAATHFERAEILCDINIVNEFGEVHLENGTPLEEDEVAVILNVVIRMRAGARRRSIAAGAKLQA